MSDVVADNSPAWYSIIQAIQLANWCDAAAVALVCYDSVLMFPREVQYIWQRPWSLMSTFYVIARYLGIALALGFWAFNANISMSPSAYAVMFFCRPIVNQWRMGTFGNTAVGKGSLELGVVLMWSLAGVAVDRFINFAAFVAAIVGDVIMCMRLYAMYLRSRTVLFILVVAILGRISLGLAVAVVIFGPNSGIGATEFILSGIYVCGPSVNTTSSLPFAWDIMAILINALLFFLAIGRFIKHAFDTRRIMMSTSWNVNELMKVLARDSILYFFLNLLATVLLMIGVWGVPNNPTFFAIVSAYTENEASVLIPRLMISFRENYAEEDRRREGIDTARRTFQSTKMEFKRRMTDDFELQTADQLDAELSSGGFPEVGEVSRRS